jgi:hypothetical protein
MMSEMDKLFCYQNLLTFIVRPRSHDCVTGRRLVVKDRKIARFGIYPREISACYDGFLPTCPNLVPQYP